MNEYEIVVVDDDIITLTLLEEALADFSVMIMASPLEALEALRGMEEPPLLIILDVNMPDMSGFELCVKLREFISEEQSDIIFHTSSSEMEERLKGYEIGANDFLIKPIEIQELRKKARSIVKRGKKRREDKASTESHSQLIQAVISDLTEQGILIHYFRAASKTSSISSLLNLIVKTATSFGISSSVQVKYEMNDIEYRQALSTEASISALERELLDRLEYSERIMSRGKRLFLNYPPFTQIIKNMPDDPAQAGRFRDHLAIILEAASSQYRDIVKTEEVNLMIQELEVVQKKADSDNQTKNRQVLDTLTELVDSVESKIFEYGLTEEQESELLQLFRKSTDKAYDTIDNAMTTENLRLIMQRLKALRELSQSQDDEAGSIVDVELF
ncbi:MAG: response regulator transcription factor [Gammaproteobacteria bacterium]|nr:response regulator transcription factor [Gammaproteobacteria bacterium]